MSVDESDSLLPDFSFNDYNDKSNHEKKTLPKVNSPKPKLATDYMSKIKGVAAKVKKYQEYTENKKEIDNDLSKDGFYFGSNGQLREIIENGQNEPDPEQELFLKTLVNDSDPYIPSNPELDHLFQLDLCNFYFYQYPLNAFSDEFIKGLNLKRKLNFDEVIEKHYNDNMFLEPKKFKNFFNQIPLEKTQSEVLNCLFLNIPWLSINCRMFNSFEILTSVIDCSSVNEGSKWRISSNLVFRYLKTLGLNTTEFTAYFPIVTDYVDKLKSPIHNLKELKNLRKENVTIEAQEFEIYLRKLEEILIYSLAKKGSIYGESELDFLFLLFTFLIFDQNYALLNLKIQTQLIFTKIADIYEVKGFWLDNNKKLIFLSENIFRIMANVFRKDDLMHRNQSYHKFIYLIEYFKLSHNKNLKNLALELTLKCMNDQFSIKYPKLITEKSEFYNNIEFLIERTKKNSYQLFIQSSYSMFNLIEFLDVIITSLSSDMNEKAKKVEFIQITKATIQETNRQIKDQMDYKGRNQVKVLISNFLNKLDYNLSKLNVKPTQTLNAINLPNFNDNTNSTYYDESSFDLTQ